MNEKKIPFDQTAQKMQEIKKILEGLPLIKTPLDLSDVRHLCRCIYRKQITIDMLSKDVLKELKKTDMYIKIIEKMAKNNI